MQIFFSNMKIKFKSFINVTIRKNLKWSVTLLFAIIFANQQIKIANGLTVAGTLTAACAQKIRVSIGESVGAVTFFWEIIEVRNRTLIGNDSQEPTLVGLRIFLKTIMNLEE